MKPLDKRLRFDLIRYANCWEDAGILIAALGLEDPAAPGTVASSERRGGRYLSIASGGDNCFALLAAGADEVVAADLSTAQLAIVELKAAAIRELDREETLDFLGVRSCSRRLATFARLEDSLSEQTWAFWSRHHHLIKGGLIHQGKFEKYFSIFRRFALPLVHRRSTIFELLQKKNAHSRREFYESIWDTTRWRWLFHFFFSRAVMGRLGRDPELFRYVDGPVSERILKRCRYALTTLPTHDNPYLEYILTGHFERSLPLYLRPGVYEKVKARLGGLILECGKIEEVGFRHAGERGFDGFNLSDIFEYLDETTAARLYASLLDQAAPGARFAYWNMLAPRTCPDSLRHRVRRSSESDDLFARDQAFFYSAFHVEALR